MGRVSKLTLKSASFFFAVVVSLLDLIQFLKNIRGLNSHFNFLQFERLHGFLAQFAWKLHANVPFSCISNEKQKKKTLRSNKHCSQTKNARKL